MNRPMKGGYLSALFISLSICGCSSNARKISATLNQSAALVGDLPMNPLGWQVITVAINKADSTMFTLFGNDRAVGYARTNSQSSYPGGSALSLVTWTQQEDSRWFGAKIPDHVKSVEFVFVETAPDGQLSYSYQKYEGAPLKMISITKSYALSDRAGYIASQRAAVMP